MTNAVSKVVGRITLGYATHYIAGGKTDCGRVAEPSKVIILPSSQVATCLRCRKAGR